MDRVKPEAVIFDVDGTLCDVRPIRHYVEGGNRDFDSFHKASAHCLPNDDVVEAARIANIEGKYVIVVTGRAEKFRRLTAMWMITHEIPFDELHMRPDHDFRKDVAVKKEILEELRQRFTVTHAWDDNPSIIKLWEDEGIPVTVVPGWDG